MPSESRSWVFFVRGGCGSLFFLLFHGGVELFCDIVKSAVVVGEIVPVLVPVLVPVEFVSSARMPSSRTWFLATGGDERQLGHQVGG